ncbi:MAG: histidine kinase [Gemmatimonadota bacterium]
MHAASDRIEPGDASPGWALRWPNLTHLVGWLVFGLVFFLAVLPFMAQPEDGVAGLTALKAAWALSGWALSTGMGWIYRRVRLDERGPAATVGWALFVAGGATAVWMLFLGGASVVATGSTAAMWGGSFLPFVTSNQLFILLAWTGGWLALRYWSRSQWEARRSLLAFGNARDAQLAMLRYQLNPHFLFNALASLRALINEDPGRARETVSRLSDFLRYTLGVRDRLEGPLSEELDVVRAYLDIERVRFEERLDATIDADGAMEERAIPTFLLHALVENAVKHGGSPDGRLSIRITARGDGRDLVLGVANTGTLGAATSTEGGIGLANVRARLEATYGPAATLRLVQDGAWVRATVRVPSGAS